MGFADRAKVFSLTLLSYLASYMLSGYVLYVRFFSGETVSKVEWGMAFMVGISILMFIFILKTNKKVSDKKLADEIARNLGQPSVATPSEILLLWTAAKSFIFLGLLAWFTFLISFYGSGIYEAIIVIGGCFLLGYVIKFIAVSTEQSLLKK